MTIQDVVREQTREIADALALIDARRREIFTRQSAAEDRLKRASTEITRQRALETERKRLVTEVDERLRELQGKLDEIERQRQEILERLLEKRESKEQSEQLLKDSRQQTEKAYSVVREETEFRDAAVRLLNDVERERSSNESRLREAYRRSVDDYLGDLTVRVEQAFAGEEERNRRLVAADAFRNARHEDPQIGDLCDQRDQFRELMRLATVPAVAETLRQELLRVERELEGKYPGALTIDEKVPPTMLVEELYYLTARDGGLYVILPISEGTWLGIGNGDTGPGSTRAMRIVWEMISGLRLKSTDGRFCVENGYCMFFTKELGADDMTGISGFTIKMQNAASLTFRFCPLPAEVQEAFVNEAADA